MYVIIGKRTKEGFKTVERRGNPEELDLGPMAEILVERLLRKEAEMAAAAAGTGETGGIS